MEPPGILTTMPNAYHSVSHAAYDLMQKAVPFIPLLAGKLKLAGLPYLDRSEAQIQMWGLPSTSTFSSPFPEHLTDYISALVRQMFLKQKKIASKLCPTTIHCLSGTQNMYQL